MMTVTTVMMAVVVRVETKHDCLETRLKGRRKPVQRGELAATAV